MAHTYMIFDFPGEEMAQQARHKLETWKQAFRLDKKLQYKLDRGEEPEVADPESDEAEQETKPAEKSGKGAKAAKAGKASKSNGKGGKGGKGDSKSDDESDDEVVGIGPVKVLVRLYFSAHEKMSEKRILDKINGDDLFKNAPHRVAGEGKAGFAEALAEFDRLGGADRAFGG
jgi:hypothetical protein